MDLNQKQLRTPLTQEEKYNVYENRGRDILLDFDGTLSTFNYPDLGQPTCGAREAMQKLQDDGFRVIIWSSRFLDSSIYTNDEMDAARREIMHWLMEHKIPFNGMARSYVGKAVALAYIDDRGIRFDGDWADVLTAVGEIKEREDARHALRRD